jgi:carboxyl-terminal processing protease
MASVKKHLWASGAALATLGGLMGGAVLRDRAEMGSNILDAPPRSSIFASMDEDPTVPESDFFYELTQLVKREYVDKVDDDQKLAEGAVRGMVNGLGDPNAEFLGKEQFAAFKSRQAGLFEGIGVELQLRYDDEQKKWLKDLDRLRANPAAESPITTPGVLIPSLVVSAVAPGGPADRAGLKVGDTIVMVEGKKVLDSAIFREFQAVQAKVRKGEAKLSDLTSLRKRLSEDAKDAMSPGRARERLVVGKEGEVRLGWKAGGTVKEATLGKRLVRIPPVSPEGTGFALKLFTGADKALAQAIDGKSEVTLDLRNSTVGDFDAVQACLEVLAAPGPIGEIKADRQVKPKPVVVARGDATPPRLRLVVDSSTRGAAAVFAAALAGRGQATLEGKIDPEPMELRVVELPTGAGYLLPIGKFASGSAKEASN